MRIAIYHNLPSGGAKRSLYEITKRLASRHSIDVYTLSSAEHGFKDIRPFVKGHFVTEFVPGKLFQSPFGRLNQLVYLNDLFRLDRIDRLIAAKIDQINYDVVFIHHCRFRQSPGILRFLNTPTVYYCQEPPRKLYDPPIPRPYDDSFNQLPWHVRIDPLPGFYRNTYRKLDLSNVQNCRQILANSYHSREIIWRVYGKEPIVCYLGVDTNEFKPIPITREPIILSVGSINPVKGYDLLIKGISKISVLPIPALVIISNEGDPREANYLSQLAEQLGVNLQIKPIIDNTLELSSWYSKALVTGYTPVLEPMGLVPLESMACETAVVGITEGGLRETVIDGLNGKLIADRDPEQLAEVLNEILMHPQRVAEMGRRGRTWVQENWSWERTVTKVEGVLQKVAANGS
jgi:glycosyltransferase involved in cell wall biosynthesis